MKNNANAKKDPGESEVKPLKNSLSSEELIGTADENENCDEMPTGISVVEVRMSKRLPKANRVVKMGAVHY